MSDRAAGRTRPKSSSLGPGANEIEICIPADTSGPGTKMKGPAVIFRGTYRQGSVFDDLFSVD
jgi:hypothetical protein